MRHLEHEGRLVVAGAAAFLVADDGEARFVVRRILDVLKRMRRPYRTAACRLATAAAPGSCWASLRPRRPCWTPRAATACGTFLLTASCGTATSACGLL